MALVKRCAWPGCTAFYGFISNGTISYGDLRTGKCPRHGKWVTCGEHADNRGLGIHCPLCRWESPEVQERLHKAHRIEQYTADFRAQGYGDKAAGALAARRVAEEKAEQNRREQEEERARLERAVAERRQMIRDGKVYICPSCRQQAPSEDGIILPHKGRRESEGFYSDCVYGIPGIKATLED